MLQLHIQISENDSNNERTLLVLKRNIGQATATESTLLLGVVHEGKSVDYNILTSLGGTVGYLTCSGNLNCAGIAKKSNVADDATSQSRFRNIKAGTSLPTLNNGEIFLVY